MPLNPVLIKDGHEESAEGFVDLPELEAFLNSNHGEAVCLQNDVDLEMIKTRIPTIKTIIVDFPNFADGRGFSIARELRKKYGYKALLIAEGPLIPDQYAFALQCGFDAIKVDGATYSRQSESDWFNAMGAFSLTYQRGYAFKQGPALSVFDARQTSVGAMKSNDPYFGLSAEIALRKAIDEYQGKIVMVSSLGADSAVLLHLVSKIDKDLPVYFLDTGKHFRETLTYRDLLIEDLGLTNFKTITPNNKALKKEDPEGLLHRSDPDLCCNLRKVRPLDDVLTDFEARITGRKRYQTPDRKDMPIMELGGRMAKINPLAYWTAKDVKAYIRKHDLAPHPMFALGYLSIGCQPCTTRVAEGEDPRAGRWRNNNKTECGIHYIDGKWVQVPTKKTYEVF